MGRLDRKDRKGGKGGKEGKAGRSRRIRYATTSGKIVVDALGGQEGWVRVAAPDPEEVGGGWYGGRSVGDEGWDVFWGDVNSVHAVLGGRRLATGVRINHFRNHYELTRKDLMTKNIKAAKRAAFKAGDTVGAAYYDILPASYALPQDYALFLEEFRRKPGAVWIMKPIARSQGRGIFLFNKLSAIASWRKSAPGIAAGYELAGSGLASSSAPKPSSSSSPSPSSSSSRQRGGPSDPLAAATASAGGDAYVVQEYVGNPYLIGGKKFDMRIYVAVLSYSPLVVYLYRSGFARFSSVRFSGSVEDLDNSFMHLTNVAVQKKAEGYQASTGAKWGLNSLKRYLRTKHKAQTVDAAFGRIQDLILASLSAVSDVIASDRCCFELYGYDVLLDDRLRPWLLEVNASPSMSAENGPDYALKYGLISDTLALLDLDGALSAAAGTRYPPQVGGFDLIYNNGPVSPGSPPLLASYLGTFNDRQTQLASLFGPSYTVPTPPEYVPQPSPKRRDPSSSSSTSTSSTSTSSNQDSRGTISRSSLERSFQRAMKTTPINL